MPNRMPPRFSFTVSDMGWMGLHLMALFAAGAVVQAGLPGWYENLNKPTPTPSSWVFSVVWTALYVLMALTQARLWRTRHVPGGSRAVFMGLGQLGLNVSWVVAFFYCHRPDIAMIVLVALLIVVVLWMISARRVERFAAHLQWPYLVWIFFAAWLNLGIVLLN